MHDEYTGDLKVQSPIPLYFKCNKCKKNIWAHLYNEHLKFCRKNRKMAKREIQGQTIPARKERLVNITSGKTKSRHRKRPPVGR